MRELWQLLQHVLIRRGQTYELTRSYQDAGWTKLESPKSKDQKRLETANLGNNHKRYALTRCVKLSSRRSGERRQITAILFEYYRVQTSITKFIPRSFRQAFRVKPSHRLPKSPHLPKSPPVRFAKRPIQPSNRHSTSIPAVITFPRSSSSAPNISANLPRIAPQLASANSTCSSP